MSNEIINRFWSRTNSCSSYFPTFKWFLLSHQLLSTLINNPVILLTLFRNDHFKLSWLINFSSIKLSPNMHLSFLLPIFYPYTKAVKPFLHERAWEQATCSCELLLDVNMDRLDLKPILLKKILHWHYFLDKYFFFQFVEFFIIFKVLFAHLSFQRFSEITDINWVTYQFSFSQNYQLILGHKLLF